MKAGVLYCERTSALLDGFWLTRETMPACHVGNWKQVWKSAHEAEAVLAKAEALGATHVTANTINLLAYGNRMPRCTIAYKVYPLDVVRAFLAMWIADNEVAEAFVHQWNLDHFSISSVPSDGAPTAQAARDGASGDEDYHAR